MAIERVLPFACPERLLDLPELAVDGGELTARVDALAIEVRGVSNGTDRRQLSLGELARGSRQMAGFQLQDRDAIEQLPRRNLHRHAQLGRV